MFLPDDISAWPHQSLFYALPYLAMALLTYIIGYKKGEERNLNRCQAIILFVAFLLFFGLRWHLMTDTLAYEEEYYSLKPRFSWAYIDEHSRWWDKGFVVFAMLCKKITPNFFFFVFVNTLVDITLFTLCLKKYKVNPIIAILSFLAFQGIMMEINTLRNIKSILLFVYSISYIQNRQLLKFLFINVLGFTFHSSALLFFPMYWLLNRRYSMKLLLPIMVVITVIYFANIDILQDYLMSLEFRNDSSAIEKFNGYLNNSRETILSVGFIERLLTLVLCLSVYNRQDEKSFNLIVINSFFLFYILFAVNNFNDVFRNRFPYLFVYAYWFLYPYLFEYYGKRGIAYKSAFLVLFFCKIYLSTRICPAYYETVLFHETTRQQRQHFNEVLLN